MTNRAVKPVLKAMLVCDQIITEAATGKRSLIGIFERIQVKKFPYIHPSLSVYIKFSEVEGGLNFTLELVDVNENKTIGKGQTPKPVMIKDRLHSHDLVFNLTGLKFPHSGLYEFRIYANGTIFGQKVFQIKEKKP